MASAFGNQTGDWQHHRPLGEVSGFYFTEELAGPHGAHLHLWIDNYSPKGPEVTRALRYLQSTRDMVSWSYSRCLPEQPPFGMNTLLPLKPAATAGSVEMASAIFHATQQGEWLSEDDQAIVFTALGANETQLIPDPALNAIYADVASGCYPFRHNWLCGIEHLTRDSEGYVYWKGEHIEHYSHASPEDMRKDAEQLSLLCRYLEATDRKVTSSSVYTAYREFDRWLARSGPEKYFLTYRRETGVEIHPFKTPEELLQQLKSYVPNWQEAPIKSAAELRELYCTDAVWNEIQAFDAKDEAHRAVVATQCACDDSTARALISAAQTGESQNVSGTQASAVDWVRENHIRGKFQFAEVRNLGYALELAQCNSNNSLAYDGRNGLKEAAQALVDTARLKPTIDLMREFVAATLQARSAQPGASCANNENGLTL